MSLPSEDDIIDYITEAPEPVSFKELAGAFGIRGDARSELRRLMRSLSDRGIVDQFPSKKYGPPAALPDTAVVEVTGQGVDGEILARPVSWEQKKAPPRIEVEPEDKGHSTFQEGDRLYVRLTRTEDLEYIAEVIRRLDTPQNQIIGQIITGKNGYELKPANKKMRHNYALARNDLGKGKEGDLVLAEKQPQKRHQRGQMQAARVLKVLGRETDTDIISLISIQEFGLREHFPPAAMEETKDLKVPPVSGREDLRQLPLVTIDPVDARDFDDAIFARETSNGFDLTVAIADVSYYIRPGSALDHEALERGNSTYFPDRVVPMLPEALSNDLCSLRPKEERACLAVHMKIDKNGVMQDYRFVRALMKSRARLTYEQMQAAIDGRPDHDTKPLLKDVVEPIYAAYQALKKARNKRGVMDLDLPERKILFGDDKKILAIKEKERLDAHQIVEEFMILANVAAARALSSKKAAGLYRVHDKPDPAKLDSLREFCQAFGLSFPKGPLEEPGPLARMLEQAKKVPFGHLIQEIMLRSQKRAVYAHENIGHFGLALDNYTHFTSPIRRYADLIVHRMLVDIFNLGPGALDQNKRAQIEEICMHISRTERISAEAEWSATDRYLAIWLEGQVGKHFQGQITGLNKAGLFIRLKDTGADAFAPMRTLPQDYFIHDESRHALIGRRTKIIYRLGADIDVELREADPISGNMIVHVLGDEGADIPGVSFKPMRGGSKSRGKGRKRGGSKGGSKSKNKPTGYKRRGNKNKKKGGKKGR